MADRVAWGASRESAFKDWIDAELKRALEARQPLEAKWRKWLEQYRAPADRPLKSFPFEGAANFELPVTAIDVDQLYAKFIQTIHAPANLWTMEPLNPDWDETAKPVQDFLEWLDKAVLQMEGINKRAILEMVKLGTCLYKTGWLFERRKVWTYDEQMRRVQVERMVSRPIVDHVRLADFVIPPYAYDINPDAQAGAPWVAERFKTSIDRLDSIADAAAPYLPNYGTMAVQRLRQYLETGQTDYDAKIQDLDYNKIARTQNPPDFDTSSQTEITKDTAGGTVASMVNDVEWWQIHARFPTQAAGGSQDDIIVEYHVPTRLILRAIYQPYAHGQRPYDVSRYFPGEGFYGIGVCEQKEMSQRALSDLYNYTHDNVLLSNAIGLAAKAGSNIAPGEPWYPGKLLITDGPPREELMAFQLGSTYPNLTQIYQQTEMLGRQATGVSDLNLGSINQLPSRTPATTVQSMLEEGARRPDLTLKDLRGALGRVGLRVLQLLHQYMQHPALGIGGENYSGLAVRVLGQEAGLKVVAALAMTPDRIEHGLGVNLTATSASANKELAKQNLMALLQLQGQVAPQVVQLLTMAMQAQGTPVGQAALDGAQGMAHLLKKLYEQSDIRNVNELVPTIPKDAEFLAAPPGGGPALQLLGGGGGAPPGAPGASGVEALRGAPGAGGPGGV